MLRWKIHRYTKSFTTGKSTAIMHFSILVLVVRFHCSIEQYVIRFDTFCDKIKLLAKTILKKLATGNQSVCKNRTLKNKLIGELARIQVPA